MKRRVGGDAIGDVSALSDDAQNFYRSFENRAKRVWESVSAPYRKATREEIDEFIEEGDVEEDEQPHFAMRRELDVDNPEDEIIEALRQGRMSQGGDQESEASSGEGEDTGDDGSSAEDVENPDNIPGYYSEEEEEDDDWVTSKLARPGRRNKVSPSSSRNSKTATKGKRLGKARGDKKPDGQSKRDADSPDSKPAAKKVKRSRIIIESDSDNEE